VRGSKWQKMRAGQEIGLDTPELKIHYPYVIEAAL
jgi:hypothetical protein